MSSSNSVDPKFESEDDRERERRVAEFLQVDWRVKFNKLPIHMKVDYAVVSEFSNSVLGFAELKRRTYVKYGDFKDLHVSLFKLSEASKLVESTGLPFWLIVQFTDSLRWIKFDCEHQFKSCMQNLVWAGRNSLRVSADKEVMVEIPMTLFKEGVDGDKTV